jgi:heme exporter protein A
MDEAAPLLALQGLGKRFGYVRVLREVDLELRAGELLLLLGPNGAGKTTLTRLITTLSRPGAGGIRFRGEPLSEKNRWLLRREAGYLSHQTFLYGHLSAAENLRFFGRLYGIAGLDLKIPGLLSQMGLDGLGTRPVAAFSRGMQQRLSLARVLLTEPKLLILDEPYAGLDPQGSRTLTDLLGGLKAESRAVLLVTHDLEDCLPIADRIAILHKGAVAWQAPAHGLSLEEIRREYFRCTAGEALE